MNDGQMPDLDVLAGTITERLSTLSAESSNLSRELAELVARVRTAIEDGDSAEHVRLLVEVQAWLDGDLELREDIRDAFQLYYIYAHLKNGGCDGSDE